ncbi:MAG: hypothetical protein K2X86_14960 [Cytophagaceae bacterium]|nr:hypothetical protein [Cytophagaceae bacterium]
MGQVHFKLISLSLSGIFFFVIAGLVADHAFLHGISAGIILLTTVCGVTLCFLLKQNRKQQIKNLNNEKQAHKKIMEQIRINAALSGELAEMKDKIRENKSLIESKTKELYLAKEKIYEGHKQLNNLSAQLDLKDREMRSYIKEKTESGILSEEVSCQEFSKNFPDELSCYQYLDDLKWGKEYKCRKCTNTKYSTGEKAYMRKCTRCKYAESVTAYTLFHGVKFPLNKAFYIVYTVIAPGSGHMTIDELSERISLRRNTCWSFRKKVLERREELQRLFGGSYADKWENLLLEEGVELTEKVLQG